MASSLKVPSWKVPSAEGCDRRATGFIRRSSLGIADFVVSLLQRFLGLGSSVKWPICISAQMGGKAVHPLGRVRCDGEL